MKRVNVVYCLILNKESNKILMVYNKDSASWTLPGGAVEDKETLEDVAIREVKEETGFLVEVKNILAVNECKFAKKNEHVIFFTFRVKIVDGEMEAMDPNEISEIVWVDISKAEELMPYYQEGIEKLFTNSSTYFFQGIV